MVQLQAVAPKEAAPCTEVSIPSWYNYKPSVLSFDLTDPRFNSFMVQLQVFIHSF